MESPVERADTRVRKRKMSKRTVNREELESMTKSELIDKILKLEANNEQLRILISRSNDKPDKKQSLRKAQKPFDFSQCSKRRVLLKFYYLGWEYDGFVVQEDTPNTVERYLFDALKTACLIESRETSNYQRCGRTDKGVSSFCQVISLDVRSKLTPSSNNEEDLTKELPYCKILNRLLPTSIRCLAWRPIQEGFSARFDCKSRTYKYFFPRGDLDIEAMRQAAEHAIGTHDFRNVCKMDVANGVINFERAIHSVKIDVRSTRHKTELESGYDICELTITSQAFLWHQIRCFMGVLLLVGRRKEKPEIMKWLLDVENCPRKPQYNMAHEIPLNLWHCEYEQGDRWYVDQEELVKIVQILQKDWTINTVKSVMIDSMLSELESSTNQKDLLFQDDCLLLGVQSKVYCPLAKRVTCESLEDKIRHYEKKGRFEVPEENNEGCAMEKEQNCTR